MLSLNQIKLGSVVKINEEPYVVIKSDHHKVARGGAVLKTKLKNMITGNVIEKTWQGNDKAEEAEVEKKPATFTYSDGEMAHFMDSETYEQFTLQADEIEDQLKYLKDNTDVDVLYYEDKPVTITLPIKIDLKVVQSPPGIKGNSAGNVMKTVKLESGLEVSAPLFVEKGDTIRINTDSGEYVERV